MSEHPGAPAVGEPGRRQPARVVDALGSACPLPVIWLAAAVDQVDAGQEVVVLADDAGAKVDIPVWCRMRQQEFVGARDLAETEATGEGARKGWRFTVRKVQ